MRPIAIAAALMPLLGFLHLASAAEPDLNAAARAFLDRPAVRSDVQTALRAKASRLPDLCPGLQFTPTELFLKSPPPPAFDAAGALTNGAVRQRFSSTGCGDFKPLFNIWVIAAPGAPLRTISAVPGTTRAFVDLQEKAVATLADPARALIPNCPGLGVVDTKLLGFDTPADDPGGAFREDWLVGGCGKLAIVPLHFIPDKAAQATAVEITGPLRPAALR